MPPYLASVPELVVRFKITSITLSFYCLFGAEIDRLTYNYWELRIA